MNRQQDKQITYPGGSDVIESACSAGDLGSLGGEDPLEKKRQPSILALRIPWTEPDGLPSMALQRVGHD